MKKLSVIIVSWNAKDYLVTCLHSLIQELIGVDAEIIVVDNYSSDGSSDIVEKIFPAVKLIRNDQNLGFAKANNIGIKASSGDYVCLINSDIVVNKNCIRRLLEYMDSNANVGVVGPRTLNADGTLQRSCFTLPTVWNSTCRAFALDTLFPQKRIFGSRLMTYWSYDEIRTVEALNGCFLLVRREALNKVGLLDENFFIYGEDMDWCKRFGDSGWGVIFNPWAEAVHYGGASSSNSPIRFYLEMHKADLQYWRKHKGLRGEVTYFFILLLHHTLRIVGYAPLSLIKYVPGQPRFFKLQRSVKCLRWLLTRHAIRETAN